jgi:two-component system, NarL family, response regulator NreC
MPKIRIMIADDHAILRAGLRSLLNAQPDMEVVAEAIDGEQTVDLVAQHTPDVLLLDITMPKTSGIKALEAVREVSKNTRVLVLTMHDDHAYLRSVLAAGGAGYLVKRAADTELLAAIRAVHQGRSYIDVSLGEGELSRVLDNGKESGSKGALSVLSDRERQVLELVALGYTHKEVADKLSVSVKTIETYRGRLSEKLGLRSRAELVRYALDAGLLTMPPPDRE